MGKRKVGVAIVALVALGAGVTAWFMAPREKVTLELTFLCYTNEALPTQTPTGPTMRLYSPLALMQASNSGNCSLEVLNVLSRTNHESSDFARPLPHGFPMTLKPGETGIFRVQGIGWRIEFGEPRYIPWRTEITYRRPAARARFLKRLWNAAGTTGRQWLNHMDLWPEYRRAACGPVTNPLPYVPKLVSLTNYFLDVREAHLDRKNDTPFNLLTNFPPKASVGYELKK